MDEYGAKYMYFWLCSSITLHLSFNNFQFLLLRYYVIICNYKHTDEVSRKIVMCDGDYSHKTLTYAIPNSCVKVS